MKKLNGFMHGVDLGGWLSQCDYSKERMDTFVTEPDFEKIASLGLDHVRLPFDFNVVETANGSAYLEEGFARLRNAVDLAKKYQLNIILDLHKTCGFSFDDGEKETGFFDSKSLQDRFYRLWEQMANRFGKDEHVAFELLNEVTDQAFSTVWNRIAAECIRRIRLIAPDTLILIGSYWNNHASAVKDMDPPADDKIVYNFHSYDPLEFTHQGAYWVKKLDQSRRVSFEEAHVDEAYFEQIFGEAIAHAEKNNAALYCGEYGVIDIANDEDALRWFECIHAVFEKHGIGHAAWNWREMDFELKGSRIEALRVKK